MQLRPQSSLRPLSQQVECATHKNERSTRTKRQTETARTLRPDLRAMIERMNAADVALYEAGCAQFDEQLRELGMAHAAPEGRRAARYHARV